MIWSLKNKSSEVKGEKVKDLIYDFFDISTTTLMKRCFSISLDMEYSDVEDTYLASSDRHDPDTLQKSALTQAISKIENGNLDTVKEK